MDGTTGYDFLNRVGGLFVDPSGEVPLTEIYAEFTGETIDYPSLVLACKRQVLTDLLGSDVNRLCALFVEVCERHRRHRDYTRHELREVLRETAACFPVYRSYVRIPDAVVRETDVRYVTEATERAVAERPDLDPELFRFLADLLLLRVAGDLESELAARFQQLTGPAMAKGMEDTAMYRYLRLAGLNEVGGDPGRFGTSPVEFHRACIEVLAHHPRTLLAAKEAKGLRR